MKQMVVLAVLALGACSKKQDDAPAAASQPGAPAAATPSATAPGADKAAGGADPWKAETPTTGGGEGEPDDDQGDPDDGGEVAVAAGAGSTPIQQLCARDAKCGCPIKDCEQLFAKVALPAGVIECFVEQSCEDLCAKNSGAPGSALYKTCMEGKVPTGDTGTARKRCQRTQDCGGQSECCGGFCYEMGTSLWITACQMPSGKF